MKQLRLSTEPKTANHLTDAEASLAYSLVSNQLAAEQLASKADAEHRRPA